jgi:hypothetical protein
MEGNDMADATIPKNFTEGQRHALLILAGGGAVRGDATDGGATPADRRVHHDVADWLVARDLAADVPATAVCPHRLVVLTEAGEAAAARVHPQWYARFGPGASALDEDRCRPADGYHSTPHRGCILR